MKVSAVFQKFRKAKQEVAQWINGNPLKVSGITGMLAEGCLAYAGEYSLANKWIVAGGLMGVSAHLIELVWGRGGKENTDQKNIHTITQPAKPRIWDIFSIQKSLCCWRYPVESSGFHTFLSGICFTVPAISSYLQHGSMDSDTASLFLFGISCMAGGFFANGIPEQEGKMNPLVKAAICYGICTASLLKTAIDTLAPSLIAATILEGSADIFFGKSIRHDNNLRQPASALAPQTRGL